MDLTGVRWRKSSFSGGEGGGNDNCVEIALAGHATALRDSKDPGPALVVPTAAWTALLTDARG